MGNSHRERVDPAIAIEAGDRAERNAHDHGQGEASGCKLERAGQLLGDLFDDGPVGAQRRPEVTPQGASNKADKL